MRSAIIAVLITWMLAAPCLTAGSANRAQLQEITARVSRDPSYPLSRVRAAVETFGRSIVTSNGLFKHPTLDPSDSAVYGIHLRELVRSLVRHAVMADRRGDRDRVRTSLNLAWEICSIMGTTKAPKTLFEEPIPGLRVELAASQSYSRSLANCAATLFIIDEDGLSKLSSGTAIERLKPLRRQLKKLRAQVNTLQREILKRIDSGSPEAEIQALVELEMDSISKHIRVLKGLTDGV